MPGAGLEACWCLVDQAVVRHFNPVLLILVVLQMLRVDSQVSVRTVRC